MIEKEHKTGTIYLIHVPFLHRQVFCLSKYYIFTSPPTRNQGGKKFIVLQCPF